MWLVVPFIVAKRVVMSQKNKAPGRTAGVPAGIRRVTGGGVPRCGSKVSRRETGRIHKNTVTSMDGTEGGGQRWW